MHTGPRTAQTKKKALAARVQSLGMPSMKQAAIIAGLVLLVLLIGSRVLGLVSELRTVSAARTEIEGKRSALEERHRDLEEQARFVADPDNLEQELRSRFNYKRPGENVVIVVPPKEPAADE